ncbi:hypothetical protein DPMN_127195 [Dreissena polymorpha]|uniref:Uncharacterized protein n=1 Tax=Dreissena polymorpha TaxID=45954 RepID=A0A9D4JV84_DREPO|nr:hypothetical protein DPMN_127195 [Dreissena polymorpha]
MPAGVCIYDALVTSQSVTVVWSVSSGIENCAPSISYDAWGMEGRTMAKGEKRECRGRRRESGDPAGHLGDDIALSEGAQNFYREYSVKVAAYNDLGHGPNLTEKVIYSAEDNVETENATCLIVHWIPLEDMREGLQADPVGDGTNRIGLIPEGPTILSKDV